MAFLVEPPLGLLADRGLRRRIVLAGGAAFAGALVVLAGAPTLAILVVALSLLYPASGAFVSLSQAVLMDAAPAERDRNMLRWTIAGSGGALAGPLLLAAGVPWRLVFLGCALAAVPLVGLLRSRPELDGATTRDRDDVSEAAIRRGEVLRWLLVLELQDVGGDVFAGFVALYFAGAEGAGTRVAALAVAVWAAADLGANLVLVRFAERLDGLRCLRFTAAAAAVVLPAFLLVPGGVPKLVALAAFAALRSCWYPLSQARLYAALPGRSSAVTALSNLLSPIGIAAPLLLGALAASVGLGDALWAVLVAPLAVLAGTPGCTAQWADRQGTPGL